MTSAYVGFAFLCIVFGTTFGAIKIGLVEGWPPLLAAGLRFTLAGALVLTVAAYREEVRPLRRRDVLGIVAVALTVTAGTFGALYSAERVLASGLAALLSATSPLFAVALAVAAKRRRLDGLTIAGIVLGTLGVTLVGGVGSLAGFPAIAGAAAIVISELGYAWGLGYARAVAARVPMLQLAGAQQLFGGAVLLVVSLAVEHRGIAHASTAGILALLYLVVVASAGAHTVSIWLAARTNPTFASSWTYVSPFIALGFGAILLREPLGPGAWAGGILVVAGALLLNADLRARRRRATKDAQLFEAEIAGSW